MSTKDCPACRITNPATAEVCDCGYIFSASSHETLEIAKANKIQYSLLKNKRNWFYLALFIVALKILYKLATKN